MILISAHPPLQVTPASVQGLQPMDFRDLPSWAGVPDNSTVMAYRYSRPGYRLTARAHRFEQAETLRALIESVNLSTVIADDGQTMTEMALSVRNHGLQHLEITLPKGSSVWSAFVAGQPVRPSVRGERLLVPLERGTEEGGSSEVVLTYVGTNRFPKTRVTVELISCLRPG